MEVDAFLKPTKGLHSHDSPGVDSAGPVLPSGQALPSGARHSRQSEVIRFLNIDQIMFGFSSAYTLQHRDLTNSG